MTDTTASADGAVAPEKNTEIPVQTSAPEPLIVATDEPDQGASETSTEVEASTEQPATEGDGRKAPPKLPDWAQKQMAQQAFEAREANRRAKELEAELAKLKAGTPPTTPQPIAADEQAAANNAPAGGYKSEAEFNAAVQAEASRRQQAVAAQQQQAEFDAACNAAYQKGKADPGMAEHFDAAVQNLQQLGFMNRDMLDLVIATEDPAKVLFELGSDPDKAAQLLTLPPAKRAVEIAKMSVAVPAKPAALPVSNAPRPVATVEGSARPNATPQDNDDDATWFAKRNAEIAARNRAA